MQCFLDEIAPKITDKTTAREFAKQECGRSPLPSFARQIAKEDLACGSASFPALRIPSGQVRIVLTSAYKRK